MTSERSSPKEFIKIAAPTNISFTNTHIRWNQTGINESQVGKMTYDIYNSVNNVKFSPSLIVSGLKDLSILSMFFIKL